MSSVSGCVKPDFLTFTNWLKIRVSDLRTRESWGWVPYLWRSSLFSNTHFSELHWSLFKVINAGKLSPKEELIVFPLFLPGFCSPWAPAAIPAHLGFTHFSHAMSLSQAFTWGWIKCDKWAFAQCNNCVFLPGFGQDVPDKPGLSAHPKRGFVIKNNSTSSRAWSCCCC